MTNTTNKGGRPDKTRKTTIALRDKELVEMYEKGYPLDFLATYFNLTKGRVVQIYNSKGNNKINNKDESGS